MASQPKLKVLERCQISPPLGSVPPTFLPLTFFDIPWLLFPPCKPLFFFDFPHSTANFTQTLLPSLKHSLSLTLQTFFPLAGVLITPPPPTKPHLSYTTGNSITLIIAESTGDFNNLCGHQPRKVNDFYHLVPQLPPCLLSEGHAQPLLAIQITVFPKYGICMAFTYHHAAADGRTFNNFLMSWSSICRSIVLNMDLPAANQLLPCHLNRSVIRDLDGLEPVFLEEWRNIRNSQENVTNTNGAFSDDMVRATFVMGGPDMEKLQQWILTRSKNLFGSHVLYLSPYVLTCSLVWVCLIKTLCSNDDSKLNEAHFFGFIAGGITRLDYAVPSNYFGNCIAFGRSMAPKKQLMGENGIIHAAKSLGDTIMKLDKKVLGGAKNWITDWKVFVASKFHVSVVGSPKVNLYGLDFGWGKPRKIEEVSIDGNLAISLCESRDLEGGMELGLALPKDKMDVFCFQITNSLRDISLNTPLN